MTSRRTSRLGQQLLREISLKIHNSVRDPDVGGVSVTGVDLGADLWLARVYVVPSGSPEEQERTMAALARAAPFLRSSLGRELHIRRMPELRFERDDSIEAARRIDDILREVLPGESQGEAPRGAHRELSRLEVPDAAAAMEVLLVDKPTGCTSHDIVALARRSLRVRKAGHAGTLDPIATGLLVLGLGRATRLLGYLAGLDKEYEAVARLGAATDTLDREGEVVEEDSAWVGLADAEIRRAASGISGTLEQTPPSYSAVKVGGVAAHRRTRRGEKVELRPRRVVVRELEIVGVELPQVRFRVLCSSGTYVRSLAAELGRRLGTSAHIAELRRTRVGSFSVADAASLAELRSGTVPRRARMGPVAALSHLPSVAVDERDAARLANGAKVLASAADSAQATFVADEGDQLVAVGEVRDGVLHPRTVFRYGVGGR